YRELSPGAFSWILVRILARDIFFFLQLLGSRQTSKASWTWVWDFNDKLLN
ncbi:6607_t:CDS:2, partial [Racocetra persica]